MVKCTHCGHHDEMAGHVTKCEGTGVLEFWNKSLKVVGTWLVK
jgi:hypothetical protein